MRIKKHRNGNEYLYTEQGLWVRNFVKAAKPVDVNNFTQAGDRELLLKNQLQNVSRNALYVTNTNVGFHANVLIVSDGLQFMHVRALLEKIPANVWILGVNRSLAKWDVQGKRIMDAYVVNNPYRECLAYLPSTHRYYPLCLASTRTYPEFVQRYRNNVYLYTVVSEEKFSTTLPHLVAYNLDDYRNPICAAMSLAYRAGVVRLLLLCCDDAFATERPGAMALPNGAWIYPQQLTAHGLIDGMAYWLKSQERKRLHVAHCSSAPEYREIPYISADQIVDFFSKEL